MEKLTAIMIVKDEEGMIRGALGSLRGKVDEILVIDTGSYDKTVSIAKKFGARVVIDNKGGNFSDWRNRGLKEVQEGWVFYLDADERVDDRLMREIRREIKARNFSAFAIPRRNTILGQEFKHGGFWPDYVKRLFERNAIERWEGELHEEPVIKGELGHLKNSIKHIKHENFYEMVEKTNQWSEVEAKLMKQANHPSMNVMRFVSVMAREFWHRMIIKKAFLDGKRGIMFAMYQVFSKFVSYAKLWEMQTRDK